MANTQSGTTQNAFPAGSGHQPQPAGRANAASAAKMSNQQATAGAAQDSAQGILEKATDSAGQAYGLATDQATAKIEEQKTNLSSGLSGVADSLRQVGQNLRDTDKPNAITDLTAQYGESIAAQLEKVSAYFAHQDLPAILRDTEDFARRQPAIFIGAAFGVGLLAARFLKSSSASNGRAPRQLMSGPPNGQYTNQQHRQTVQPMVNAS